ncbi:U1 small nuclear ribonucleoprotein 70 kDa-like isoform X1 [Sorex araneus]|uniref:U1 small nuclear ribonucleoprotein 70 kDa-like isoform X1 n=1 Tax=Sorex araneus TaxID=42254 RepID=UPI002433A102|nr:U1 small nuclear ribonucleoprotein 70 kDa-like isoform X1 [Sorex araneus]
MTEPGSRGGHSPSYGGDTSREWGAGARRSAPRRASDMQRVRSDGPSWGGGGGGGREGEGRQERSRPEQIREPAPPRGRRGREEGERKRSVCVCVCVCVLCVRASVCVVCARADARTTQREERERDREREREKEKEEDRESAERKTAENRRENPGPLLLRFIFSWTSGDQLNSESIPSKPCGRGPPWRGGGPRWNREGGSRERVLRLRD